MSHNQNQNPPDQHLSNQHTLKKQIVFGVFTCIALTFMMIYAGGHSFAAFVEDGQVNDAMDIAMDTKIQMEAEIKVEEIVSGLDQLVDIQHAGDERLFIMEKSGRILILDDTRTLLDTPFLDIQDIVASGGERGLLGIAFHPDYATNGYFYLNYTVNSPDRTRISRFTVSATDINIADATSELVIMEFDQPFSNHNGGQIQFGPDNFLYIATGDGGSGGDPNNAGQNPTQLLGKILRVDIDSTSTGAAECYSGGAYTIPASNPYVGGGSDTTGTASNCDEIWATGLRNPWRFSFDAATGDMWIADVGQNAFEEIDFQPAGSTGGENYGWRCFEGDDSFDSSGCQPASAYVAPVHTYGRGDGCSVTGGVVYRGSSYPALVGHYIFADYCTGNYWTLSGAPSATTLTTINISGGSPNSPAAFGTDLQGELYVASRGSIFHMQNPDPDATPIPATAIPATATPIPATATPVPPAATPIPGTSPVPQGNLHSYLPMVVQN